MSSRDGRSAGGGSPGGLDDPPNSRLFILCPKGTTEREFRECFEEFGVIEDIWIVKDKRTNEDRGIAYIKFSKTSEAMRAMEEMNGRTLPGSSKGLKVVVANSKRDGSTRDPKEDERLVRLFVIIPKSFTEQKLREEFSEFGEVETVTVLKDHSTGENKGFGYVRYFKPLHAALAYERCDISYRPKFAEPQRSRGERDELESHNFSSYNPMSGQKRLYEDDYRSNSSSFTDIFQGGPSSMKGMGSHRPGPGLFDRKPGLMERSVAGFLDRPGSSIMDRPGGGMVDMLSDYPSNSTCSRLVIQAPVGLTQNYLSKLFNLVPGMEYCDLNETTGVAYARYANSKCAAYARDKLNGFEYPLGSPLHVQLADEHGRQEHPMSVDGGGFSHFSASFGNHGGPGLLDHTEVKQKAAMILEKAGINPHNLLNFAGGQGAGSVGDGRRDRTPFHCSMALPPPQPLVAEDGNNLAQRLFIVCQPSSVPEKVLKDAFCRFGNLIDVYLLSGRNYGYAKFASKASAMKAINVLHGQLLGGQKLKVLEAEPPKSNPSHGGDEGPSKKQRL